MVWFLSCIDPTLSPMQQIKYKAWVKKYLSFHASSLYLLMLGKWRGVSKNAVATIFFWQVAMPLLSTATEQTQIQQMKLPVPSWKRYTGWVLVFHVFLKGTITLLEKCSNHKSLSKPLHWAAEDGLWVSPSSLLCGRAPNSFNCLTCRNLAGETLLGKKWY